MPKPNFYYPETWGKLSVSGGFWIINTLIGTNPLYLCPECSAVVVDTLKHFEWHQENDKS